MGTVFEALSDAQDAVFCGDTNINEQYDGEVQLPYPWRDAWLELRPQDGGYTFDVERNEMLASRDKWAVSNHALLRFDRFWVKLTNYNLSSITLLDSPFD